MSNQLMGLVKKVQFDLKLSREEVAQKLGYTREHLYTLIKKDDPDTITKMYRAFHKELTSDDATKDERIAAMEAAIRVIFLEIIQLKSIATKQSITKITLDLESMIKQELKQ